MTQQQIFFAKQCLSILKRQPSSMNRKHGNSKKWKILPTELQITSNLKGTRRVTKWLYFWNHALNLFVYG